MVADERHHVGPPLFSLDFVLADVVRQQRRVLRRIFMRAGELVSPVRRPPLMLALALLEQGAQFISLKRQPQTFDRHTSTTIHPVTITEFGRIGPFRVK
jgi:hypothetical protein